MARFTRYDELELVNTTVTASGNSGVIETSRSNEFGDDIVLYLDVTAATGTSPTSGPAMDLDNVMW
jgi:hypothetical protein